MSVLALSSCSQTKQINIGVNSQDQELFQSLFELDVFKNYKLNLRSISKEDSYNAISEKNIDAYLGNIDYMLHESDFLKKKIVARDSLSWIVNSNNPVNTLNVYELKKILKGSTQNWKELFGHNEPILFIGRYEEAFADDVLLNYPDFKVSNIDSRVQAKNEEDLINNITKFKNSISYINSSSKFLDKAPKSIKRIFINTNGFGTDSKSQFQRDINLYYQPELFSSKNELNKFKHFIALFNTREVRTFIKSKNYQVPLANEIAIESLEDSPVKIGIGVPTSGTYARFGKAVIEAVKIAKEEFEESGGILGRDIELVICDDEANIEDGVKAISCAKEFIAKDVDAVIGHLGSEATIATSNIYQSHEIVQISPTVIHSGFTKQSNNQGYLFRIASIDSMQAKKIADLVNYIPKSNEKRVLISHNGGLSSTNLSALIFNHLPKDVYCDIQAIEPKTKTYYSLLGRGDFNIMVLLGPEHDPGQILIDLAVNNKSDVTVIATSHDTEQIIKKAGLLSSNAYTLTSKYMAKDNVYFHKFKDKILKTTPEFIPYVSVNSYFASKMLFEALKQYYKGSYYSLANALHEISFDIWDNDISFDEFGDRLDKQLIFEKIESGNIVRLDLD
ncbi:MAG: ABC transporter substrate-binding protein [Candidatus Caenarcaniphilales bacterium]|nr:ABC transporter substrate-binding protein [Candidatus Caenarcaniphilales bacterium]